MLKAIAFFEVLGLRRLINTLLALLRWIWKNSAKDSLFIKCQVMHSKNYANSSQNINVAVFQYEWTLQSHTLNLVEQLAVAGYNVLFFVKDCSSNRVDLAKLKGNDNVSIFCYSSGILGRILLYARIYLNGLPTDRNVIEPLFVRLALPILKVNKCRCYIGVEKKGLIWATRLSENTEVSVVYYSLELYGNNHPHFKNNRSFRILHDIEKKCHAKAVLTIIQDKERAEAISKQNGVTSSFAFLPVSVPRSSFNEDFFLHDLNCLDHNLKLVVYFGQIDYSRFSIELAKISGELPAGWRMVFHGFGAVNILRELSDKKRFPGLVLSLQQVCQQDLAKIFCSTRIGLVFYGKSCENDLLTAFSSEKIAFFLQRGIPVIAFNHGNFPLLLSMFKCGKLIASTDELPRAIEYIDRSYSFFSQEASRAYSELYDFNKNFQNLLARLNEVVLEEVAKDRESES